MNQNQNPQMPVPPEGVAAQSPQAAAELRYASELIKAVGGDIAQLAQNQNEELGQLDSLSKQIAYVREVLDYGLFVTPDQVERKEDLYPFAAWLYAKLEQILLALNAQPAASAPQAAAAFPMDDMRSALGDEVRKLEVSLKETTESLTKLISDSSASSEQSPVDTEFNQQMTGSVDALDEKLSELGSYVQRMESRQDDKLQSIRKQLDSIKEQSTLSPYDDFDVQVEELRLYLKEQTARWRVQENIFFGAVILMLFINMGMLLWLNMTS